jgi:hypothetical protein
MRLAVLVSLIVAAPVFAQKGNTKATGWHTDYATARAEAKRTGKPLFVVLRCEP